MGNTSNSMADSCQCMTKPPPPKKIITWRQTDKYLLLTEPGLSQAFNCLHPSRAPVEYSFGAACLRQTHEEVREHGTWSQKGHYVMDHLLNIHIMTVLNVLCL